MKWVFKNKTKTLAPASGSVFQRTVSEEKLDYLVKKNRKALIQTMDKEPQSFYHVSLEPIPKLKMNPRKLFVSWLENPNYFNPMGFWISKGSDWIKWLPHSSQISWNMATYIYKVVPSKTVLRIHHEEQFLRFVQTYRNKKCRTINCVINWKKVAKDWDGLIISPYLGEKLLGKGATYINWEGDPKYVTNFYQKILGSDYDKNPAFLSQWYRHWEIASGVIWHKRGIQDFYLVKKLDTFDHLSTSMFNFLLDWIRKWV